MITTQDDIVAQQKHDFERILKAGFDTDRISDKWEGNGTLVIGQHRRQPTHRSKSCELPIYCAGQYEPSVTPFVTNISNNFYFYFMGLELHPAIPATLLWPISKLFGRVALSGHVTTEDTFITNFTKHYHNVDRIQRMGFEFGAPLQGALAISYIRQIAKLPVNDILDAALYKTKYGALDAIDGNAVDSRALTKLFGIEGDGLYECTVSNLNPLYESMQIDYFDTEIGGSSVHFKIKQPLPPIPIDTSDIFVQATPEMMAAGLKRKRWSNYEAGKIPVAYLASVLDRYDYDSKERQEEYQKRYKLGTSDIHAAMWAMPLEHQEWTINTPNQLDAIATAFMLNFCLPQVLQRLI